MSGTVPTTLMPPVMLAPAQVIRGEQVLSTCGEALQQIGSAPMIVGGTQAIAVADAALRAALGSTFVAPQTTHPDCSEAVLERLEASAIAQQADYVIAVGGGKALDTGKLLAHQLRVPVVTIPTTGATCAAWTALSNVYSDTGAFHYDVALEQTPRLLILDYDLIRSAPQRTLVAGIGDALAKWYEASVSSGDSQQSLIISAVQQARLLRDLLFQRSLRALAEPGSEDWQQVIDATVLLAGMIGGLGGAQCRTVAAHAIHNGLTHLPQTKQTLHGEKVAYGILVQLRLEEIVNNNQLAATARQQLLQFYEAIDLPQQLADLGLANVSLSDLQRSAEIACAPESDIHHLPFKVDVQDVLAAMVSTTVAPNHQKASLTVDA